MRIIVCALALASASAAFAQPYVARGEFNGWGGGGDLALNETFAGSGKFTGTATGQTPGQGYEYKATTLDWSYNAPSSNGRVPANAAGEIAFNFFPNNSWSDGWFPNAKPRVGYEDPLQFSWEVIGSFNGWSSGLVTLAPQGGGLYAANAVLNAGTYQFKFRKVGDWGYSIGDDFGNSAADNSVTVAANGDTIRFDLDLPNGRWTVNTIPEPASLALLALGGLLAIRRR